MAAANRELITLYLDIGRSIVERQETEQWGSGVIDRLATDLRAAFPEMEGFSPRNLRRMRAFYLAWQPVDSILPQCKNRVKAEYALRGLNRPIGVADWETRLVESLPENFAGALPSVEELERELSEPGE